MLCAEFKTVFKRASLDVRYRYRNSVRPSVCYTRDLLIIQLLHFPPLQIRPDN